MPVLGSMKRCQQHRIPSALSMVCGMCYVLCEAGQGKGCGSRGMRALRGKAVQWAGAVGVCGWNRDCAREGL